MKKIMYLVLALVLFSTSALAINEDRFSYSVRATSIGGAYQEASNGEQRDVSYDKSTLSLNLHQDKFSLQSYGSMTMQVDRYNRRSISLDKAVPTIMWRDASLLKYSQLATLTTTYRGIATKQKIMVYVFVYLTSDQAALFYADPVDNTKMYGQVFDNTKITECHFLACKTL